MDWTRLRRLAVRTVLGIGVVAVAAVIVLLIALFLLVGLSCGCSKHLGPQVTFQYEVVEREGHPDRLNITHYGGDSASNERLYVTADIRFRAASGGSATDNSLSWKELGDDGEEVSAGDSVLLEPSDPELDLYVVTFDIVWWGTDFDGELVRVTIDRWEGVDVQPTPMPDSTTVGSSSTILRWPTLARRSPRTATISPPAIEHSPAHGNSSSTRSGQSRRWSSVSEGEVWSHR